MKKLLISNLIILLTIGLYSCKEDPPVCDFDYSADGLTVTFTAKSTNTDSYLWDFGDGENSTEMNPVHKYSGGGDFEVKLTVTGGGGTDSKKGTVTVTLSTEDVKVMLTGGPDAANGKTWVLKTDAITEGDGASAVEPSMVVLIPVPADFYGWMGREKDDGRKEEFTFKYDGSYSINTKNDTIVAISLFAFVNNITVVNSNSPYGTCRATGYTPPSGATWTLNETDIIVDAITNPSETNAPPAHGNVTFTGKRWLSFSTNSYIGFLDFTTSSNVIIESISPTQMKIALMVCMYAGAGTPAGMPYINYPTHIYHMTFVTK
ncbi:MAG TPA: PKD domain-containing protein [Bacteroidales bacterium]|nr:PKD domain-containing protein [Bacteroidales bacterium]